MRQYNKYHAKKVKNVYGEFDSKKEFGRYLILKHREELGFIEGLQRQVPYVLIDEQREPDTVGPRGGVHKGKVLEKACTYVADFVYVENGYTVVEDAKGFRTPVYKIKKKLMLWRYGIVIQEV